MISSFLVELERDLQVIMLSKQGGNADMMTNQ